jgi:hypothetical protein
MNPGLLVARLLRPARVPGTVTQKPLTPAVEEACEHRDIGRLLDRVAAEGLAKGGGRRD